MEQYKIYAAEDILFNYEAGTGGDAGLGFIANCPICKMTVRVAEHQWWTSICSCGLHWKLNIEITAEKEIVKVK